MKSYRDQQLLDGPVTPIVSNDCNFMKGSPGQPSLLTWVDATTLFHEFGHALHGLCSNVTYPTLSGTSVSQDFVELPSQLLEHWLETPEVLAQFALHHETGAPMPPELVEKLREAQNFNSGFTTVEYLSCALLDMELHLAGEVQIEPSSFEREALARIGMPREVIMRHRLPHFLHIFGDDGYSAGYYSYLWADTLAADAWEAFLEAGSPWDEGVAARLRAHILSAGNVQEPLDAYRAFRGRDAGSGALMRQRGFA
jgi:peptidyl-dipeptidase Dcp